MSTKEELRKRGRSSRRKGHNMERWLANELKLFFPKARRQLEYQIGLGVDLEFTGDFLFQCKAYKEYVSINTINEIPITDGKMRVLVTKGDRKEPMVVMPFKDFKAMLEVVHHAKL